MSPAPVPLLSPRRWSSLSRAAPVVRIIIPPLSPPSTGGPSGLYKPSPCTAHRPCSRSHHLHLTIPSLWYHSLALFSVWAASSTISPVIPPLLSRQSRRTSLSICAPIPSPGRAVIISSIYCPPAAPRPPFGLRSSQAHIPTTPLSIWPRLPGSTRMLVVPPAQAGAPPSPAGARIV